MLRWIRNEFRVFGFEGCLMVTFIGLLVLTVVVAFGCAAGLCHEQVSPVVNDIPDSLLVLVSACAEQNNSALTFTAPVFSTPFPGQQPVKVTDSTVNIEGMVSCLIDAGVGFTINGDPVPIKESGNAD